MSRLSIQEINIGKPIFQAAFVVVLLAWIVFWMSSAFILVRVGLAFLHGY